MKDGKERDLVEEDCSTKKAAKGSGVRVNSRPEDAFHP